MKTNMIESFAPFFESLPLLIEMNVKTKDETLFAVINLSQRL